MIQADVSFSVRDPSRVGVKVSYLSGSVDGPVCVVWGYLGVVAESWVDGLDPGQAELDEAAPWLSSRQKWCGGQPPRAGDKSPSFSRVLMWVLTVQQVQQKRGKLSLE